MYCKHCGNQIADDSIFCQKCGKLVIEASPQLANQSPATDVLCWIPTDNLQWERPRVARYVQIGVLVILGLLSLYPIYCFVSGGEAIEYWGGGYGYKHHEVYVNDPWELKVLKFTSVKMSNCPQKGAIYKSGAYSFSKSNAQNIFRWKMLLVLLPFIALIWLTIRWMIGTRFPGEKDIVPRDVADEIEQYDWNGFTRYKYVFFKKDGKVGIIDARNYCVSVPAQYDSIVWRMPNKTFDVTIGEEKQTVIIPKSTNYNPNKKEINEENIRVVFVRAICVLLTIFTFIMPLIAILLPDDASSESAIIGWFCASFVFAIITYYVFKNTNISNSQKE